MGGKLELFRDQSFISLFTRDITAVPGDCESKNSSAQADGSLAARERIVTFAGSLAGKVSSAHARSSAPPPFMSMVPSGSSSHVQGELCQLCAVSCSARGKADLMTSLIKTRYGSHPRPGPGK